MAFDNSSMMDDGGYVRLISKEGHIFHVERKCAMVARTLKAALTGGFQESSGTVRLTDIPTPVLERIIQYFHYKLKYANSRTPPPEFVIEPEMAVEVLTAANYLGC